MLILFDIDGTLLRMHGVGLRAMEAATAELLGKEVQFGDVGTAGRMDPLIWRDAVVAIGEDPTPDQFTQFRAAYRRQLDSMIKGGAPAIAMPGTSDLVNAVHEHTAMVLGMLTGNFPETGRMKVEAAGFDTSLFRVCAWGDDGDTRRDLPVVAMQRYAEHTGRELEAHHAVIIGDTPNDVDCAHANGCRCIAVTTGIYDRDQLTATGADLVLDDLSDVDGVMDWILGGGSA